MAKKYNGSDKEQNLTRVYENMRGVDFSEVPRADAQKRFGYLENMYVDYFCGGSVVESVPGFRILHTFASKIHSIFSHRLGDRSEYILVHAGTYLYRFNSSAKDSLIGNITTLSKMMKDGKSEAVAFGDYVLILDGEKITVIYQDGTAKILGDQGPVYVPSLSSDGNKAEAINLICDACTAVYHIKSFDDVSYGSPGLTFRLVDDDEKYCEVSGISDSFSGALHIPAYATVDGKRYKVKSIGSTAFRGNNSITEVYTNDNLETIGKYAFWCCRALRAVHLSNTVRVIEHHSFYGCTSLRALYVGAGFEKFEVNCFEHCDLSNVYYADSEASTEDIIGKDRLGDAVPSYNVIDNQYIISIPINDKIDSITSVNLNAESVEYEFDKDNYELIIALEHKSQVSNSKISIVGKTKRDGNSGDFFSHDASKNIDPKDAIYKCTHGAVYDGRIFLSGNPLLPGYVFYSSIDSSGNINPFYYSANDFFVDGVGKYDVTSLLATQENLVVFKSGDDGSGSVFYHTPEVRDGIKKYPTSYIHKGVGVPGKSYCFYDDIVFLGDMGLCALEKSQSNGTKRVRCRSSNVNPKLFTEDIKNADLTEWCGYLVISTNGRIYLADSRDKFDRDDSYEYEWYYLNGVGTYLGESPVYRYSSAPKKYLLHPNADEVTSGVVKSYSQDKVNFIYYVIEDRKSYEVYKTEEMRGGVFKPATAMLGVGSLLYFGTEFGDLCIFNNDKRGVAPDRIKNAADFNPEEYKKAMGDRIHPDFYDFACRPVRYVAATVFDDCDAPDKLKSSLRSSLTIKCKTFPKSLAEVRVSTDRMPSRSIGKFSMGAIDFYDVDFRAFSAATAKYVTLSVAEYERGWLEKQISLYSDKFRSPIGLYSIIYHYKIKGKIKSN